MKNKQDQDLRQEHQHAADAGDDAVDQQALQNAVGQPVPTSAPASMPTPASIHSIGAAAQANTAWKMKKQRASPGSAYRRSGAAAPLVEQQGPVRSGSVADHLQGSARPRHARRTSSGVRVTLVAASAGPGRRRRRPAGDVAAQTARPPSPKLPLRSEARAPARRRRHRDRHGLDHRHAELGREPLAIPSA